MLCGRSFAAFLLAVFFACSIIISLSLKIASTFFTFFDIFLFYRKRGPFLLIIRNCFVFSLTTVFRPLLPYSETQAIVSITISKGLLQSIRDFFSRIPDRIRGIYRQNGFAPHSDEGKFMRSIEKQCQELYGLFGKALTDAGERYQKTDLAKRQERLQKDGMLYEDRNGETKNASELTKSDNEVIRYKNSKNNILQILSRNLTL